MINRLKYLLLTILLMAAIHVAGQYSIDKVCVGTERYYRVTGEPNSTYTWNITDAFGVSTTQASDRDTVGIIWNMPPGIYQLSVVQHGQNNCDANIELGIVEVFAHPTADAGNYGVLCDNSPVTLNLAVANNYSELMWTTSGDGSFNNDTILNPTYTPGAGDILAGSVTLTITASGLGKSGTCIPAVSSVTLIWNTITAVVTTTPTTCFGITDGTVTFTASGGIIPYTYILESDTNTTGLFTGLAAGSYDYKILDANNCETTGNVTVTGALQLAASYEVIQIDCYGAENGSITVLNSTGGSGNYEYSLDSVTWQTQNEFTGLGAGAFTVYMRDADATACVVILGDTTIIEPMPVIPLLNPIGPLCQNSVPPVLPAISVNNITGSWNPATINTAVAGTGIYIFTPDAGQCAISDTIYITVDTEIIPQLAQIGPLCQNSVPPALPDTSVNGIEGIWNPATINTTVSGTGTYIFTPDSGQCAVADTLYITVNNENIPDFAPIGPLCQNSSAPVLPGTSINGVSGNWNPASISTTVPGIFTYIFTPDTGQCAVADSMLITINEEITAQLSQVGPLCQNSVPPLLPDTSVNGISGVWNPSTINTAIAGTTSYIFTPDAGQCAIGDTISIVVTSEIIPWFAAIGPLCQNSVPPLLPDTSMNGITGFWNPATVNTAVAGQVSHIFTPDAGQCAVTDTLIIIVDNEIIPVFEVIGPLCQNSSAPALPDTSVNGIIGTWLPAVINTAVPGTFSYIFTPDTSQCSIADTLNIVVNEEIIPVLAPVGPLCQNSAAPALPDTSVNGYPGTWQPATINTTIAGTSAYIFTPTGSCAVSDTLLITVTDEIIPVFDTIFPLCENSVAPALPDTSLNGVTGTWMPATISTTVIGTSDYVFTPDAGQCAIAATIQILVTDEIEPVFTQIGPLCVNSVVPELPDTSVNNITGTWLPPVINTSVTGTTLYVFTPDTGQCAIETSMEITITNEIVPVFNAIAPLCLNSTPPELPATSNNGITGTWNPAVINTSVAGTYMFTFTPDAGQCATSLTIGIMISDEIIPLFASIGPLCQNSVPPALPGTSLNGISGTWMPATINTSVTGSFDYIFTPNAGQCAVDTTITIVITTEITPLFAPIGPLCLNSVPPLLPGSSNNVPPITGTWSPALINTTSTGTTVYTFTPDAGQCAVTTTMAVTITDQLIPVFTAIPPLCENSVPPLLPGTSLNGITGTWVPATINTANAGTTIYTFTPDAGQCAITTTMEITITGQVIPLFAVITPVCQNSVPPVLPGTSLNGITGTWVPATINTTAVGTSTYTFNPAAGQCADTITIDIEVTDKITPLFVQIGPLCINSTAPVLPVVSINVPPITGVWSPAVINTSVAGTTKYTFTPDGGQCAEPVTMDIEITDRIIPVFEAIGPFCRNSIPPSLPDTSVNGIAGTWTPATISTTVNGSATYTFTPDAGECAVSTSINILITSPTITEIKTYTSTNGLNNGYVKIIAEGEATPLSYSLNGIDWQTQDVFTKLLAGTYTAWVKDANGCMAIQQFVIMNTVIGEVLISAGDQLSCIGIPVSIPVSAYNFTNVSSFTIEMEYDPALLIYNGFTQVNNLLGNGVLTVNNISAGTIQITFTSNDTVSIPNDDLLFLLNFQGLTPGQTELVWNWLQCVIYSAAGYEIPTIYTQGSVIIRPLPQIFTTGAGSYCENTLLQLGAGSLTGQNLAYSWVGPDGTTVLGSEWDLGSLTTTASGEYTVTAIDSTGCSKTEKLLLKVNPNPVVELANYDTICQEQVIELNAGPGYVQYLWQNGSTEPKLIDLNEGIYWVVVTDTNGCIGADSVFIRPCELLIWMPNAFTPNGDGLNDVLLARHRLDDLKITFKMTIFNKWGEELFNSTDINVGWDGTFKGQPCPVDQYTWMISFIAPPTYNFLQISPQRGSVMLLK